MPTKDDIATAIQSCADVSGDLDLVQAIGTPGQTFVLRGETEHSGEAFTAPGFLDCLLEGIAAIVDAGQPARGQFTIPAPFPAPVVIDSAKGIVAATTDPSTTVLTITFGTAFPNAFYFVSGVLIAPPAPASFDIVSRTPTMAVVKWSDPLGVPIPLVGLSAVLFTIGT